MAYFFPSFIARKAGLNNPATDLNLVPNFLAALSLKLISSFWSKSCKSSKSTSGVLSKGFLYCSSSPNIFLGGVETSG